MEAIFGVTAGRTGLRHSFSLSTHALDALAE
jgi:hypothetical protein